MSNSTVGDAAIAVVRRNTEEVQGKGNWGLFEELFADDFLDHTPQPGTTPDKDGVRVLYKRLRVAFPDFRPEIHWQVAAGDLVTTYKTYHGTHQGEFLGIPATGKKVSFYTVDAMRAVDGKLTEQPPATMKDEGLADAKAANPFRLPRLHPGICRVRIKTKLIVRTARALPRSEAPVTVPGPGRMNVPPANGVI